MPYLVERWNEGCRNGKRLYREIRERGYANSEETCARFIAQLRRAEARGKPPSSVPRARRGSIAGLSPTSKNVAALFVRREEKLSGEQKAYLGRLCGSDGSLADAHRLTQDFAAMVRDLQGEKLDGWLDEAEACAAPAMRNFAAGLKKDLDAVRTGLRAHFKTATPGACADRNTPKIGEYLLRSARPCSRPSCLPQGFEMHSYGGVVQRAGGGLREQAQAREAAGLREGGLRTAQGEDGGRLKATGGRSGSRRAISPRCRQSPRLLARPGTGIPERDPGGPGMPCPPPPPWGPILRLPGGPSAFRTMFQARSRAVIRGWPFCNRRSQ